MYTKQLDFWPTELNQLRRSYLISKKYARYVADTTKKAHHYERTGRHYDAERLRSSLMSIQAFANEIYG
jgi:hypothetical protein